MSAEVRRFLDAMRAAGAPAPTTRRAPRSRAPRPSRIFNAEGVEVFVSMPCLRCGKVKPFSAFGLRRMDDGKIRDIPWCKPCRGARSAVGGDR